jgi:hypothetical protein
MRVRQNGLHERIHVHVDEENAITVEVVHGGDFTEHILIFSASSRI